MNIEYPRKLTSISGVIGKEPIHLWRANMQDIIQSRSLHLSNSFRCGAEALAYAVFREEDPRERWRMLHALARSHNRMAEQRYEISQMVITDETI